MPSWRCQAGDGRRVKTALGVGLAALLAAGPAAAAWLDADAPDQWSRRDDAVPAAPTVDGNDDPRCRETERPAETAEERAVAAKGWRLFHEYVGGWGIRVVWALAGYDGMCRPWGYQVFVFADGRLAGALSPAPMNSRTDASLTSLRLLGPAVIGGPLVIALFDRYADSDPLCCPTRRTTVQYRVDRSQRAPALITVSARTGPIGP